MVIITANSRGATIEFPDYNRSLSADNQSDWELNLFAHGHNYLSSFQKSKLSYSFRSPHGGKCTMTHQILGLNEGTMIDFINRAQSGEVSKNEVYKGTRFGRKSYNIFSLYAMLLKKGLPAGVDVHIGVKWKWEHTDLERYIVAIQKALGE